jgi:hypothetical protein
MIWLLYKDDGEIVGAAADEVWAKAAAGDALNLIEHDTEINIREYLIVDGAVTRKPDADIASEAEARKLHEAWRQLRFKRSRMLVKSDWTQAPDAPVDAAAWAAYRQALRDLPQNTQDPRNVTWPEPPA